jgi:alpha,alpha-trehalase
MSHAASRRTDEAPGVRTRVARKLHAIAALLAVATIANATAIGYATQPAVSAPSLRAVREYISRTWTTLTRSTHDLPRAARDPKLHLDPAQPSPVYVSRQEDSAEIHKRLESVLTPEELKSIQLRTLPTRSEEIREHGLLYLPHSYVVPGGRFNEMYGWDSYFIQLGLLRAGRTELARNMADNFLYEIEHYGTILNANRTYFLTRSQPPFLTEMILAVFDKVQDRVWLQRSLPAIEKYYRFWTSPPHSIESVGLSRYFDTGEGPAPEVVADERDAQGRTHYDRVTEYYRSHPAIDDYDVTQFYDRAADRLTDLFYKGDRSMRESGFDPSNRFGPFSVDIIHYAPVCLNALLYRMELDAARIATILGRSSSADEWRSRARQRRQNMDRYLWDAAAGLYFDYNFQTGRRRQYPFATTFYPLWAGAASPEQARAVVSNLPRFEAPGGLLTSTEVTGSQWDAPFGWAPLQVIAVNGLRRYGYGAAADRLARKFVSLIVDDFAAHNTIVEKYDVRRRSSDLAAGLKFGYTSNEVGFGWTNAAVLELSAGLNRRQ